MDAKTMVSIGMVLVLAGAALAIVQATWKEEYQMDVPSGLNRDWSLRTQKVGTGSYYNKLDKSILHIGIGAAVVGALFVVGGSILGQQSRQQR